MKQPTQREKVEAKELAILAAAHTVFAEAGPDGARISLIARRAGVAEGTIYLYYRNKAELLDAVVGRFWQDLTAGARASVTTDDDIETQLRGLAAFHLRSLVGDYPFVALTSAVRQGLSPDSMHLEQIRQYVRVFDEVILRGIDRGELSRDIVLWQLRDLFYGTLEYSARTLYMRDAGYDQGVVDGLMRALIGGWATARVDARADSTLHQINQRLARLEARLDKASTAD